jgi:hypothetical protein
MTFVSTLPKSWYQPEMRGSHVATDSFESILRMIEVNPVSALAACTTALSRTCWVNDTPRARATTDVK